MALIDVNFYSESLLRPVTFKALIPFEKQVDGEMKPYKTLYLLHGMFGDYHDWVKNTRIALWAEQYNIAVIMPSGETNFYVDQQASHNYFGEFIGKELVDATRKLFPLSTNREDTYIAGLSMGGYGAIRNGLKYSETFSAIAGLSSALIQEAAIHSTEDAEWILSKRSFLESVFGDLTKLKGSDMDVEALVQRLKLEQKDVPRIYLACGTEDSLLETNQSFRDYLLQENIDHTYIESTGGHDWKFWDEYIEKVLVWLQEN